MATDTPNLGLIKPARGEYNGTWDVPVNANSDIIDEAVGGVQTEIINARGTAVGGNLSARLATVINADGTFAGDPQVTTAANSPVYGLLTNVPAVGSGANAATILDLQTRLNCGDIEIFTARASQPSLWGSMALLTDNHKDNTVLSTQSSYITISGAAATINTNSDPVICDINGYRQVIRINKSVTISGGSGTYYLYLTYNSPTGSVAAYDYEPSGETIVTGTTGVTSIDGSSNLTQFTDTGQTLTAVTAGDIITISTAGTNLGNWVVQSNTGTAITISGVFNSTQTGLSYTINNPISPTLNFTATVPTSTVSTYPFYGRIANRIFIGDVHWDGSSTLSALNIYALSGHYEGLTSNLTLSAGYMSTAITHNLGYMPRSVKVFGTQSSGVSSGMVLTPISDGNLVLQITPYTVSVANAVSGTLYNGFNGAAAPTQRTAGYLYVICDR